MGQKLERNQDSRRGWLGRQLVCAVILTLATTVVLSFPLRNLYPIRENEVAQRDIRSPRDLSYVSTILTQQARAEAMQKVPPVYVRAEPQVIRAHVEYVRQALHFLDVLRADPYATLEERLACVRGIAELATLPNADMALFFDLSESSWKTVEQEALRLLDSILRQFEVRPEELSDMRERVPAMVSLDLTSDEATAVTLLVQHFLRANSFLDEAETERARQAAADQTAPVFHSILRGEIIVREGTVVTALDIEKLTALGLLRSQAESHEWIKALFLAFGGVFLLGAYLQVFATEVLATWRQEGMALMLLVGYMGLALLLVPQGSLLLYLFPVAGFSLTMATTLTPAAAAGGTIYLAGVAAWIGGRSLELVTLYGLSGLVAVLILPRYEDAGSILRSGLVAGVFSVLAVLSFVPFNFTGEDVTLVLRALMGMTSGVLSAALAVGSLFVLAPLFDLPTTFRLLELSRPDQPLLKRLLREAPGTYHHVMMVASMAEQAAERIGANVLLTRVGAYYHDIGKLMRPYFFVENQLGISNPHDRLDPRTSADILIAHVRDGIRLAQQTHLPRRVQDFITEHHGTTRASFFYQKALDQGVEKTLDEAEFRYPGPRPRSRETALVMLADGCEAAARARRTSDAEELARIVEGIFDQRSRDGQLDDCSLTMRELAQVRSTYVELLRGAYHPRIQYPQGNANVKEGVHESKTDPHH